MAPRFHTLARTTAGIAFFIAIFMAVRAANAGSIVGTGTPDSCTDAAFDTALKAGGAITFNCGAVPVSINVLHEKDITGSVTIDGAGRVTLNGRNRARLFRVTAGASLTLQKISLAFAAANGAGNGDGGGNGAGVLNEGGTLVMSDSTVTASRAEEGGGAVYNKGSGSVSLIRVTLSNNTAGSNGGGLGNESGQVTLTNVTFSGNFAANKGGGLYDDTGSVTLLNNTFSDNNAGFGASAIDTGQNATVTLKNSIVANNLSIGGVPVNENCSSVTDGGHNLQFPDKSCGETIPESDPQLGTLADNGGFVLTHALKITSPALDAGNNTVCAADPILNLDARNIPRPIGAACDIGAYEADPKKPGKGFDNGVCATPSPKSQPTFIPCPAGTVWNALVGDCVKPSATTAATAPAPAPATSNAPGSTCTVGKQGNLGSCPGQQYYLGANGCCMLCPTNHLRNNSNQCVCIQGYTDNGNPSAQCVPAVQVPACTPQLIAQCAITRTANGCAEVCSNGQCVPNYNSCIK